MGINFIVKAKQCVWLFLLMSLCGVAQNPNNHWQLGVSDVNFTTNPPVVTTISNGGKYGSASISDSNGNLLLYTDGVSIWNKNHQVMQNGSAINGYYSYDTNNQPAIIVPNLGVAGQYFVFTSMVEHLLCLTCNEINQYKVSTVDFNDPLHPLGKVSNTQFLYQNVGYFGPLTVVKNATDDGYFVITHSSPSQGSGGAIYCYKISSTGLDTNPISTFISNDIGYYNYSGEGEFQRKPTGIMKFSPNGLKLGELITTDFFHYGPNTSSSSSRFFTLDFNNATGTFSNFIVVQNSNNTSTGMKTIRDFEFSSNSSKVYFISDNMYVKDLTNLTLAPRILTELGNTANPNGFRSIQRDKYGSVLVSSLSTTNNQNKYIHKIDNQDSYSSSSVVMNSISLNGNTISYLPQLIPTLTGPCPSSLTIIAAVTSGQSTKQASSTITASNTITNPASAIYHAGTTVVLTNGFNVTGGAKFRAYIEGCTGSFVARSSNNLEDDVPDYISADLKKNIKIYPNPSNSMIIVSTEDFKMKQISISSTTDNRVILTQKVENIDSVEVDVSSFAKGIYIVSIESISGEILTQKLIKN